MQIIAAFRYAIAGIVYCVRKERHMKIHITAALLVLAAAWNWGLSRIELAVLIVTIAAVMAVEMINTAIEALVDKVSPEFHPLAKAAKDAAAGAVLVQALAAVGVGYVLFWDKLFK